MNEYVAKDIEKRWQNYWQENNSFEPEDEKTTKKPKKYILSMFPYPSGKIHMGHVRNYCIGDIYARYYRKNGFNVLHPIGWDSFGMPAENAAIKHNLHPKVWTYENISYMSNELKSLGLSFSTKREFATSDKLYTKWEQEIIIKMFQKGILYKKQTTVNWCSDCQTVLSNEQVEDGKCWRCGFTVSQKDMPGYYIAITKYTKNLLDDLEKLKEKWPKQVITMQKNWIGESFGLEFDLKFDKKSLDRLNNNFKQFSVFTTRADTIFGMTYCAIALEHKIVKYLCDNNLLDKKTITNIENQKNISLKDRETNEKVGFDLGLNILHPITNKPIPVWVANFVLVSYGGGAVMCVPAHDQRDFEFASKYSLPIVKIIQNDENKKAYTADGKLINSGDFTGQDNKDARENIINFFVQNQLGKKTTNYKLRDWGVSRQRYWGSPLPFVLCDNCGLLPQTTLPVTLPDDIDITGEGNPLSNHPTWKNTICPKCGNKATKETDTMDTFVQSSWYFLRFATNPDNWNDEAISKTQSSYWMNVDHYIGGIEHAILHLLYARFFTKVLNELGYTNSSEPFDKLLTQGMVLKDGFKMSKSKGNVVDPQNIIDKYGADTARLFMMFAAPPTKELEWNDSAVEGSFRFIKRFYSISFECQNISLDEIDMIEQNKLTADEKYAREKVYELLIKQKDVMNKTYAFNTIVAAAMEAINALKKQNNITIFSEAYYILTDVLEPIIPHCCWQIADRLYDRKNFVHKVTIKDDIFAKTTIDMPITINGKKRTTISVDINLPKDKLLEITKQNETVQKWIKDKQLIKEIVVPNKLINLVVKG